MAEEQAKALHELQLFMEKFQERYIASMQQFSDRLDRIEQKTDALHKIVAGNGSDTSLVMRLALAENRMAQLEADFNRRCAEAATERQKFSEELIKRDTGLKERDARIEALEDTQDAWRNRAIGIGLALSLLGGAAALVGARLIQLFQTP